MPNYTVIPQKFKEEYYAKFTNVDKAKIAELAEQDPVIFAYYFLGKTVRLHQAFVLDKIVKSKKKNNKIGQRIAVCWARQLGKSIALGIFFIWACWYNKYPVTISNITVMYICSKEDESAIELLEKVSLILYDADRHMMQYQSDPHFFTGSLIEPNNNHQKTFLNNCFIKSIPPTMKAVGKSASWLLIDEAHRLQCLSMTPDKFFGLASAMVAETGGGILLSSTADGITGFFYYAIDPEDKDPDNEYDHFWFPHSIWDDDTEECLQYKAYVESERKRHEKQGSIKIWQAEYCSLFTVSQSSFFENEDIEAALEDTPQRYEWKDTPCSVGYDYGMTISRTVITIRTMIKGKIIQLFQYQCPAGFDINLLTEPSWEHSIQKLKQRYNLFMILPDDCPQGDQTNRWFEKNSGIQVKPYNFRSDQMSKTDGINRNCVAYSYRAKLKEGLLRIPIWNTIQKSEMKTVQETEQKILISIKSPDGHLCDTFDSDMMACIPFLDMQSNYDFEVDMIGEKEEEKVDSDFNRCSVDKDMPKQLTDEEMKEIIKNKDYDQLAY